MAFNLDDIIGNKISSTKDDIQPYKKHDGTSASNKTKPHKKHRVEKDISPENAKKILEKYTEVPKQSWFSLPVNTYIRYINVDGKLKAGGRIVSIDIEDDDRVFKLSKYSGKRLVWFVRSKIISKIYKLKPEFIRNNDTKQGGDNSNTNTDVSDGKNDESQNSNAINKIGDILLFNESDNYTTKRIEAIEHRVEKIETTLKQLIGMVKSIVARR